MIEFVIYSQAVTILSLIVLYIFRSKIFNNLFWLVSTSILIAFLPNLVIELALYTEAITKGFSELMFSVSGAIVTIFLWLNLRGRSFN